MQKKREFGLAAQLTQPRAAPLARDLSPEPVMQPPAVELVTGPRDTLPFEAVPNSDHTERIERSRKKKKPGAPLRPGGYVRRTITLGPALSDYVDGAWRTYRTIDGDYVKGVSGFIEAVLDEHRRRAK